MTVRLEHKGAAAATTITSDITATSTSIAIVDATGWPSGSVGPFYAVIGRGTASEEKIEVSSRSSTTLILTSSAKRGIDNTTASTHTATTTIEHCITASEVDDYNAHIADITRDDHTQYALTTGARAITGAQTFNSSVKIKGPSPWVDPLAYGCVGDGTTNDTVNMQAAITAAAGGTLYIPPGYTFNIATSYSAPVSGALPYGLSIPSNIRIIGSGTLKQGYVNSGAGSNCLLQNSAPSTGNSNITIEGITFDIPASTGTVPNVATFGISLNFNGCTNVRLIDNDFGYGMCQAYPITTQINQPANHTNGLNRRWFLARNTWSGAAEALATYASTELSFIGNTVLDAYDSSISINSSGERVIIANNTFDKKANAWSALAHIELTNDRAGDTNGIRDVVIANNIMVNGANASTKGVQVQACTNVDVIGNVIRNNISHGIMASDGSAYLTISNNVIDVPAGGGRAILIANDGTTGASNVNVSDNQIVSVATGNNGIDCGGGAQTLNNISIVNNNVKVTVNNAIFLSANVVGGHCQNNNLTGSASSISVSGTGWVLRNNLAYNPIGGVAVTVPASAGTVAVANYDRTFYVQANAGSTTVLTVSGGNAVTIPASGFGSIFVPAQKTMTVTYGSAPTWVVNGN